MLLKRVEKKEREKETEFVLGVHRAGAGPHPPSGPMSPVPAQVGQLTGHAGHAQPSWSSMAQDDDDDDYDGDDDDVISFGGGKPGPRFSRNPKRAARRRVTLTLALEWAHGHRHLMDCHASATLR